MWVVRRCVLLVEVPKDWAMIATGAVQRCGCGGVGAAVCAASRGATLSRLLLRVVLTLVVWIMALLVALLVVLLVVMGGNLG